MSKLNSIVALAKIVGKTPEEVQIAEENGTLESVIIDFNAANKVFSLIDVQELKSNTEKAYVENLLTGNDIPSDIYNKVKGTILQKKERELKREFNFDGSHENFDDLINELIKSNSKQPNESKQSDLERIKELETQSVEYAKIAQQNLDFKNQILANDENLLTKTNEIHGHYQTRILNDKLGLELSKIPFADHDDPNILKLVKKGFEKDLKENVNFKFNDEGKIIAYKNSDNSLITDKVGNPLGLTNVIESELKIQKISMKKVKQGDNISSTSFQGGLKTTQDVNNHIKENNISSLSEQMKLHESISVKE